METDPLKTDNHYQLSGTMTARGLTVNETYSQQRRGFLLAEIGLEISLRYLLDPAKPHGYIAPPSRAGCLRKTAKTLLGSQV
jgi:hypothetical protein